MTPEQRERRNARFRERYATDPEFRRYHLERTTASGKTPEGRAKKAERARRYRANHPERIKEQWDRSRAKKRLDPEYVEKARERTREWYRTHPHRRLTMTLAKRGLTPETFEAMAARQGGRCAICNRPEQYRSRLAVDHDHATGLTRGLLCSHCNRALGLLGDDPERIDAAANYLRRHNQENAA